MNTHRSIIVLVVLVLSFGSAFDSKAGLPEGLARDLRTHNFNLYSTPFVSNDMVLHDMKGRVVSLSGLKGRVVLLNFWRIDCPPCSMEKPILERIFKKYARQGFEVLAVNLFDPAEKQRSYVQGNGFSFTFAFDPKKNLSVKTEAVDSRIPSCFVINANSEAIYEIPGVPTTYVIDRRGNILGNSVGLINWEASPFTEFLESLLAKSSGQAADSSGLFASVAGQGKAVLESSDRRPVDVSYAQATTGTPADRPTSSEQPALKLPFQAPVSPDVGRDKATSGPLNQATGTPAQIGESAAKDKKPKERGKGSAVKQLSPSHTSRVEDKSQPKGKKKSVEDTRTGSTGTVKQLPTPPLDPYQPLSVTPVGSSAGTGSKTLPPLPPALPYTPPRATEPLPNRSVVPDQTGGVMARIPSPVGPAPGSVSLPGSQAQTSGLPTARPLGTQNPIDGFILDSFGRAGQPQPPLIRPESPGSPPPSALGQMRQDIRQLGSGIKETVSKLLPFF